MSCPCESCGEQIITNCSDPTPLPPECNNGEKCDEVVDAGCVEYTGPNLTNIDAQTGDRLDAILTKLNLNIDNQAISIEDTPTIDLTGSGLVSDKLKADLKVSYYHNEGLNQIEVKSDGVYVKRPDPVVVNTDTTLEAKVGGPILTITNGSPSQNAIFDVITDSSTGAISAVKIVVAGLFATIPTTYNLAHSKGSGASLTISTAGVSGNYYITTINVVDGGTGYFNDHNIDLKAKLSTTSGNSLINDSGLYVPPVNKVKITTADTTPGFLQDKIIAGDNITIVKNNVGANETLTINAANGAGIVTSIVDTATIDLSITGGALSADLKLDAKNLVTPVITPRFDFKDKDGGSYTSDIPSGIGYNDSDPKNPIVDIGSIVEIDASYNWDITNPSTEKAPTTHSGDLALGVVPGEAADSTPRLTTNYQKVVVGTQTVGITISCPQSGLYVVDNKVVAASGNDFKSASVSIRWKHKFYSGLSTNSMLVSSSNIKALSKRGFTDDSSTVNLTNITTDSSNYYYFCYPASFGALVNIIKNDSLPILGAFTLVGTINVINDAGYTVSYNVYRSNAINPFSDTCKLSFYL